MTNSFTTTQAAAVAVQLVSKDAGLSSLANRQIISGIFPSNGGTSRTVNIKIPAALVARTKGIDDKTAQIVLDELTETTVPINVGTHAYSAVALSEGDLNFKIEDFATQVLAPQADAVVDYIDNDVATTIATIAGAQTGEVIPTYDAANPLATFAAIRKILRDRGVKGAMTFAVGTQVYTDLIMAEQILNAGAAGDANALRNGIVGKVLGFDVTESNRLSDTEIAAFANAGLGLAVSAPAVPAGAGAGTGSIQSAGGFSVRYLRDYDATRLADRSIVSTFVGSAILPLYRIERNYSTNVATVVAVPGGSGVLVDVDA